MEQPGFLENYRFVKTVKNNCKCFFSNQGYMYMFILFYYGGGVLPLSEEVK